MLFVIVGSYLLLVIFLVFNNLFLFMQPLHAEPRRGDEGHFHFPGVPGEDLCQAPRKVG